ncbi:MAG: hypothetical protein FWC03_12060 [Treponema sp.]|nr:hypothetical protein [Treponema sp.]
MKNLKKILITFLVLNGFLLIVPPSYAQYRGAYLIPSVVYVGDPATLIVPLPGTAQDADDIILSGWFLPAHTDIDFHRIVLERRMSESRLLVEFTAFMPGILELPEININDTVFSGLTVTINSVIDGRSTLELSRPASSLAMPGTALMLYGTISALVFLILLLVWFAAKGHRYLQRWINKWKRWRYFVSIRNTEKRLSRALSRGADKREILDILSGEFRVFLSFITGVNCRAMTAREFAYIFEKKPELEPRFLCRFFRRCDEIRFSGADISTEDIFKLLDDMREFLTTLDKFNPEKEKKEEKIAA